MITTHVWSRLKQVRQVEFSAVSRNGAAGWNGKGSGEVVVQRCSDSAILLNENGVWTTDEGRSMKFKNVFRWTFEWEQARIGLEHLRLGVERPVFLFFLTPASGDRLVSLQPHRCADDEYKGLLELSPAGFDLQWKVEGPRKDEHIHYRYR